MGDVDVVAKYVLNAEYWEQCYLQGKTRWDTGQAAPPFVSLLKSPQAPTPGTMAVLGSGNGHDALLFSGHGFEVVGFDLRHRRSQIPPLRQAIAGYRLNSGNGIFLNLNQSIAIALIMCLNMDAFVRLFRNFDPDMSKLCIRSCARMDC